MAEANPQKYFSFIEQSLHYFDRPHTEKPTARIDSPAAWLGSELPELEEMAYVLTDLEVSEINSAVQYAQNLGCETRQLTVADFPLPLLSQVIPRWRETISAGIGFQVIRGVPVSDWSQEQAELFFWCFGLHLGRPGEQNPDGHLLGHVRDLGVQDEDPTARLYKTAANIDYHCDAADIVGLLCLNKAKSGGHSRIVSSVSVFNALTEHHPELAARLFEPMHLDIRDREVDAPGGSLQIQPCCYSEGNLRTFYHSDYFRSVVRHKDVPPLTKTEQQLLDAYERIANEKSMYLDMDLQPGDIQLLSNHTNLHARTAYEDFEEPGRKRHLLRLWLSL